MDNIITEHDNYLTGLILKHINALSDYKNGNLKKIIKELEKIKEKLVRQENELIFNPYIPDIFRDEIKNIKYYNSGNLPDWDVSDGIISTIKIKFKKDCDFYTGCTFKTYYDYDGDLCTNEDEKLYWTSDEDLSWVKYEDSSDDENSNSGSDSDFSDTEDAGKFKYRYDEKYANFDSKTKTRHVSLRIRDDQFMIFMYVDNKYKIIDKNALKLLDFLGLKKNDSNEKKLGVFIENLIEVVKDDITSGRKYENIDESMLNYKYMSKNKLFKKLEKKIEQ
ncbi:hypothetical protein QLL95_gp0176 [Cotonvirus japonicus]|uniref:Uncharacterized protein n=1 Tax=Cotonvirus japonicus TaxID=2811091 RepID=A0ABM7NR78_9VIRU|nr:hypothetical protein QLL95_gp0176 [Cotonvirus japonicus]BCS82665.1 hypothetical protein [Cotonvirus japonicus]